jgi:hypothetical protein
MEMDQVSWVPRRPPMAHTTDNDFDFGDSPYSTRPPSQASFVSNADSMAPLGSAGAFKCDIMVKFLRQRQMEKLWSNSEDGEGVILKRGKGDFVCQPMNLLLERNGIFEQVSKLNVKASSCVLSQWSGLIAAGCHDRQDRGHSNISPHITAALRAIR